MHAMDDILLDILKEDPTLSPDDITADLIAAVMSGVSPKEALSRERASQGSKSSAAAQNSEESKDGGGLESTEDRRARGEAEVTSAAVDMLKARDVVNELSMQIESVEK